VNDDGEAGGIELGNDVLHEEQLAIIDGGKVVETARLVVFDGFLIALPVHTVGRVCGGDVELVIAEFVIVEGVTIFDLRVLAEAAFDFSHRVKGVVPVLAVGGCEALELLFDAVFYAKEQIAAAAGAVVDFQ
jgi:hypothetical protein